MFDVLDVGERDHQRRERGGGQREVDKLDDARDDVGEQRVALTERALALHSACVVSYNTQEIALLALTGGRGVLCVYVLRSRTLQALALGAMVAIGVEADWAKSDPTGPHPYQVAPYQDQ